MKDITKFIKEELESENLLWLLDKWFERDEFSEKEFIDIVFQCQADHNTNNAEKKKESKKQIKRKPKASKK